MDQEAVQAFFDHTAAGHENIADGDRLSRMVVREGWRVVDVKHVGAHRHIFDDLQHFAAYIAKWASNDRAAVLVDDGEVVAIFDPRDLHPDAVRCSLEHHPDFAAWKRVIGKAIDQRTFFAHVRAYRTTIDPDSAEMLMVELLKIAVARGEAMEVEIDQTGLQRYAVHKQNVEIQGRIPPAFQFTVPVFKTPVKINTSEINEEYAVEVQLDMQVSEGRPLFTLQAPRLEIVLDRARRDAAAYVTRLLGDGWTVGIGKARTASGEASED